MNHRQRFFRVSALMLTALIGIVAAPFLGHQVIDPLASLRGSLAGAEAEILWRIRVPRVCLGVLAGSGLGISGMVFQSMFRNALATPYTLGVSSGASLGASIYVISGLHISIWGITGLSFFALIGAAVAILIVYGITLLRPGFSGTTTLLAGIAVSFSFSSLILFVQYLSDLSGSFRILRWLMGGLETIGYDAVLSTAPFLAVGLAIVVCLTRELNLLAIGDDVAASRGVDCVRTKRLLFVATSLMVGGIVAICGPIGFVGMMVPHVCRLIVGHDHRLLMPTTGAVGAAFLVLCDAFARGVTSSHAEVPVSIVTALFGGPFFLWLLLSSTRGGGLDAHQR